MSSLTITQYTRVTYDDDSGKLLQFDVSERGSAVASINGQEVFLSTAELVGLVSALTRLVKSRE